MFDVVGKRYWYFLASLIIIVPGLVSLIAFHLRPGIDFVGGSLLQVATTAPASQGAVQTILSDKGLTDAVVQLTNQSGQNVVSIRTTYLDNAQKDAIVQAMSGTTEFGTVTVLDFSAVGPVIGAEITRTAFILVGAASVAILLYIAWAFRNVSHPFRYGICALAALLHDILVVTGIFSILGVLFKVEVDSLFVTAMLTVIGFSVHDTIVVFDRIRENLNRRTGEPFGTVVNSSIIQTLARSLNTSITVLLTLLALYLFGGTTTRTFVLALLIGIFSGTYSSIFNASCLLVSWQNGDFSRLFRRGGGQEAVA